MGGTGEGCVEPAEVVGPQHFFGHVALVDEDVGPLPSLGFVAGNGIGVFHLQGVVVGVATHGFELFRLGGTFPLGAFTKRGDVDFFVVGYDSVPELLLLVGGEGWGFGVEGVEQKGALQLAVGIVGESDFGVDEVKAVEFAFSPHTLYAHNVAVGNEVGGGGAGL